MGNVTASKQGKQRRICSLAFFSYSQSISGLYFTDRDAKLPARADPLFGVLPDYATKTVYRLISM
jgi:hypothetical protein